MMHHPSGASRGQASEMHIESRELVRVRASRQALRLTTHLLASARGWALPAPASAFAAAAPAPPPPPSWPPPSPPQVRDYLSLVTSEATGQPYDRVIRELSRNKWMDPKQAVEYGMIDKVGGRAGAGGVWGGLCEGCVGVWCAGWIERGGPCYLGSGGVWALGRVRPAPESERCRVRRHTRSIPASCTFVLVACAAYG
jgi:hypothetical protein